MEGYLLKIDTEKAFDSVDHYFLLAILEKYGFKKNFLRWIETLLNNQESCIINRGNYNSLFQTKERDTPRWSDLCVLVYSSFFLKDKIPVFETLNIFQKFSLVSGLSPNTTKYEIAGIGTLKVVNVALWHEMS